MDEHIRDEVISDEELNNYRIRIKLKTIMKLYWKSIDLAVLSTEDIAHKMIGNKGMSYSPKSTYNSNRLEDESLEHITAKNIVETIDDIIENQLKGLSQLIIDSVYIQEESKDDTMDRIKNYFKIPKNRDYPKSTYYRHRQKAERSFYLKIIKNLNKF